MKIFLFIVIILFSLGFQTSTAKLNEVTSDDYIGLVFGAAIDATFNFIFNRFNPPTVTVKEFNKRLEFIMQDMKEYTHAAIEESILETCRFQFDTLRKSSYNYLDLVLIWKDQMRATNSTSPTLKTNLPAVFNDFKTKMEDALIQFSNPNRIKYLAKLYIDTSVLYQSLLRDAHFFGISMGLEPNLINGSRIENNFYSKISNHASDVISNYMYAVGVIITNANKCNNDPSKCRGIKFENIPAWYGIMSQFIYSDVQRYPYNTYRIDVSGRETNLRIDWVTEPYEIAAIKLHGYLDSVIYSLDFAYVGRIIVNGAIWTLPHVRNYQNFDFLTGSYGIFIQNFPYKQHIDEPQKIDYIENGEETDKNLAFYQTYTIFSIGRQARVRIYFSFSHPSNSTVIPNNFRLKVTKTSSGKLSMNGIVNHSNSNYYYNLKCSFSKNGPTTFGAPSWTIKKYTNQEIRDIHLFDRYVFETSRFVLQHKDITIMLLPIPRFAIQLYSLELIVD
ncbi:hypothetical protein ACTFIZ_010683 [Dictyostelium cf. discoideum]